MKIPEVVEVGRREYRRLSDEEAVGLYFELLDKINKAFSRKDFHALLGHCVASFPLVERYAKWFTAIGSGSPVQVPAIYYACRFFPITGAKGQLENIRELVGFVPGLAGYGEYVELAIRSIGTASEIRCYVGEKPSTKQNQLKKALGYDDGRHLSQLVKDMEYLGLLERRRSGKTYELFLGTGTESEL